MAQSTQLFVLTIVLGLATACTHAPAGNPYRRAIPVYEEVEVPICERRPEPRVAIRFIPKYEEVVDPVFGELRQPVFREVTDPCTGEVRKVRCGTRVLKGQVGEKRRRKFVGYEPEEIPIGCGWKTVQTGTETVRRLKGWRWAGDPPWPCEIEAMAKRAEAEEAAESAEPEPPDTQAPETEAPPPAEVDVEELPSLDDLP